MEVTVIGDVNPDLIYGVSGFPVIDSQEIARSFRMKLGGSAANTAYALARLGARVHFYGAVGKDIFGEFCEKELKRAGVRAQLMRVDVGTGITSAVEFRGTRTMFTYRGANEFLDISHISLRGQWMHVSGYWHLTKLRPKIEELYRRAKEQGMATSFDVGSWNRNWTESKYILSAIRAGYVDFLFANEEEITALTGMELENAVEFLRKHTTLGIHMGRRGAKIVTRDSEIYTPAWENIDVKITTGAGDTWNAAFIFALLKTGELRRAAEIAMDVVERYVEGRGISPSV